MAAARYALVLAYDGTDFGGWQVQPNAPTVQACVEEALGRRFAAAVRVHGAGRTDAGVHARAQVCHFDAPRVDELDRLRHALNSMLPASVRIRRVARVGGGFHARKSALAKHYRYYLYRGAVLSPFRRRWAWHVPTLVDPQRLARAAELFVGRHDFVSFSVNPGRELEQTVRTIHSFRAVACGADPNWVRLDVIGDGFLYRMVRCMTGTLVRVGQRRDPPEIVTRILAARDRAAAAQTAPPQGLFLWRVLYRPWTDEG